MAQTKRTEKKEGMTCKEAQAMIPRFLKNSLSDREALRFMKHVGSCRKCHEELETNFMVERTIAFLNEDLPYDASFDLTPLLDRELEEKQRSLKLKRRIRNIRMVIFAFTLVLIILLFLDLTGLFHVTAFFAH